MVFQIFYTKSAIKDLHKLDMVARKRLGKKILLFSHNPLKYATKLISPVIGTYRWRIGNYRIIFDLEKNKIIVLKIGHRREIYR